MPARPFAAAGISLAETVMQVRISARDDVMARFGNQLGSLGAGEANRLMAMALNKEGNKGRTQVRQIGRAHV